MFSFLTLFRRIGSLLLLAFKLAHEVGITDELLDLAIKWAKVAEGKFVDNDKRREFVVKMLVSKAKVPESVARLAVELAVRLLKKQLADLEEKY